MCRLILKTGFFVLFVLMLSIYLPACDQKSTEPEGPEMITISPQGGEYNFPDGLVLRVPAGAVVEETDIMLRSVSSLQTAPYFESRGANGEGFVACVEGTPDGVQFIVPVDLLIPVELEAGQVVFVHEIDLQTGEYTPAETEIICDPESDTLTVKIHHFSSILAEIISEFESLFEECGGTPCRCERVKVEQRDKDYICNSGDCQITETEVVVTFLDCPGTPVEEAIMREVSSGCQPEMILTTANTTVSTGGQTAVSAVIELGCEPIEGQTADFSINGPASVNPTSVITNASGTAFTTFTAGDQEGTATVRARSTVSYYTYIVYASAGGISELGRGPFITEELNQTVEIEIIEPVETWSGTATYEAVNNFVVLEEASYAVTFQFSVTQIPDSGGQSIDGTATASQDVNLSLSQECWGFRNLNAPPSLNLLVSGYSPPDTNTVSISFKKADESPFYLFETCILCDPLNPENCGDPGGSLIYLFAGNPYTDDNTVVRLVEDTYSGVYTILTSTTSYTITLNRDE